MVQTMTIIETQEIGIYCVTLFKLPDMVIYKGRIFLSIIYICLN